MLYVTKLKTFLQRQFERRGKEDLMVLLRKVYDLLLAALALLVVLIVRALRPLVVIRFGFLYGRRIGHFASNPEIYLCEHDAGMHDKRTFDIFYYLKPICNYQLKKMWDRMFHVSPLPHFTHLVDRLNRRLPGGNRHAIPMMLIKDLDAHSFFTRTPPHLSFTSAEEEWGCQALRNLGVSENAPFVCFHARDSTYLETVYPSTKWHFQDYRNSTIHNYIPAAEELVRRGYFAIRMGAVVKEPLATVNPMIIDYATKYRTDFLDIYLSAKCQFFISTNSGISIVSTIFRRPVVYVNFIPLEQALAWSPIRLFIPKKLWLRKEDRFLTFREILGLGIGRLLGKIRGKKYEEYGIDIIENTPEEITAVAVEMDERLKGKWRENKEDEELQRRFWSLFKLSTLPSEKWEKNTARIGAEFLRQNRELLD